MWGDVWGKAAACLPRWRHSSVYKARMEGRQLERLRKQREDKRWGAAPSAAELHGMGREGRWDPEPGGGLAAGLHTAGFHCSSPPCSCRILCSGMERSQEISYP